MVYEENLVSPFGCAFNVLFVVRLYNPDKLSLCNDFHFRQTNLRTAWKIWQWNSDKMNTIYSLLIRSKKCSHKTLQKFLKFYNILMPSIT